MNDQTMRCARHPNVETTLRCSKCETPICPRCLVQTPVGARCSTCANLRTSPLYVLSPALFVRAAAAAVGLALAVGVVWSFIPMGFGFFGLLVAGGTGYLIGEGISYAANRKRGLVLQVLAGFTALSAAVVSRAFVHLLQSQSVGSFLVNLLPALVLGFVSLFANVVGLVLIGVAVSVAVSRLR